MESLTSPHSRYCKPHPQMVYIHHLYRVRLVLFILGLVGWSALANQADLGSEAAGPGVLQQPGHSVVVEVVNEVAHSGLMGCAQLVRRQWGQRGA